MFLPRGTSPAIVKKFNEALIVVMNTTAFSERLRSIDLIVPAPERRSPDDPKIFVASEIERWAAPIRASGVTGD